MKTIYTLLLVDNQAMFLKKGIKRWQTEPLNGEDYNPASNQQELGSLIEALEKRINLTSRLASIQLHILYADVQAHLLPDLLSTLIKHQCREWQVLNWASLYQRACRIQVTTAATPYQDQKWLINTALPLLENTFNYQNEALEAEQRRVEAEHEESIEALQADRKRLEAQIMVLKQQVKSMQLPELEQLLVYLPIIYRNFWSHIKPSDLSLLAGSYQVPDIPSPFPEPDNHTIVQMKKKLQSQPKEQQQRLLDFCQQLPHNLEIRPEMRFFLS